MTDLPAVIAPLPAKQERVEFDWHGRKIIVTWIEISTEPFGSHQFSFKMEGVCDAETARMLWAAVAAQGGRGGRMV